MTCTSRRWRRARPGCGAARRGAPRRAGPRRPRRGPPVRPPRGGGGRRGWGGGECPTLRELIEVLLAPPAEAQDRFADTLREIFEFAQNENLSASLSSERAVALLSEAWRDWRLDATEAAPTLHDPVTSMPPLQHSPPPLSPPPRPAPFRPPL